MKDDHSTVRLLPVVVQLGFAGSRRLLDSAAHPEVNETEFLAEVQAKLTDRLRLLHAELKLSPHHFFCGLSQLAIGGDTLFTRACQSLNIPQRILLTQPPDEYFAAIDSNGVKDFSEEQGRTARALLNSSHVIHERVVTDAPDRRSRFEDANLVITRLSDVLVCLRRADAADKPGGTVAFLELARRRGHPVLDLQVQVEQGVPQFTEAWHHKASFIPPHLPEEIESSVANELGSVHGSLPDVVQYCGPLREFTSGQSKRRRIFFKKAALVIVGAHVAATICAVVALSVHGAGFIPWLLAGEVGLLASGLGVHHHLHHSRAAQVWALSRLVSEISRSVRAAGAVHVYLDYLFALPLPQAIRPLLRTLNVLHLRTTRPLRCERWEPKRDDYVRNRFTDAKNGQLMFYRRELREAKKWLGLARKTFHTCALCALAATIAKLLILCHWLPVAEHAEGAWATVLGALAIVMPVLAVAALSLAASFDQEALVPTYGETLRFLEQHEEILNGAASEREFTKLLLETEACLLGETATWASRRTFKGVE